MIAVCFCSRQLVYPHVLSSLRFVPQLLWLSSAWEISGLCTAGWYVRRTSARTCGGTSAAARRAGTSMRTRCASRPRRRAPDRRPGGPAMLRREVWVPTTQLDESPPAWEPARPAAGTHRGTPRLTPETVPRIRLHGTWEWTWRLLNAFILNILLTATGWLSTIRKKDRHESQNNCNF